MIAEIGALLGGEAMTEDLDEDFEIIFPESDIDDRSVKINDIVRGELAKYISHERAATMYASEMNINDYDPDDEREQIEAEVQQGVGLQDWEKPAIDPDLLPGEPGGAAPEEDAATYTQRNKTPV